MSGAVEIVAGAYAVLLLAAAVGKLDGWRRWSTTSYRLLPQRRVLARRVRVMVPLTEAAVALLTFVRPSYGLIACGGLFLAFAAAVSVLGRNAAGEDCGCFGALLPSEIGTALVMRNLGLAAPAAALGGLTISRQIAPFDGPEIVLAMLIGILVVLFAEFSRSIGFSALVPVSFGKAEEE